MGDTNPPETPGVSPGADHRFAIIKTHEGDPSYNLPVRVAERLMAVSTTIHLFTDGSDREFNEEEFHSYLIGTFGPRFTIDFHGDLRKWLTVHELSKRDEAVTLLVRAKMASIPQTTARMLEAEAFEQSAEPLWPFLRKQTMKRSSLEQARPIYNNEWYDLRLYIDALRQIFPHDFHKIDNGGRSVCLVVTGRGIANAERRGFHMRVGSSQMGIAVVSTTGIVEAPGQSSHSYWDSGEELVLRLDDRIRENDPRMTEAMRGSALQMLIMAFGETGKHVAQCSHSGPRSDLTMRCRLRDAHLWGDVIATQIKNPGEPEFCAFHTQLFDLLQAGTTSSSLNK